MLPASYKFGDLSRGVAASFREPNENQQEEPAIEQAPETDPTSRYAQVGASNIGAAIGLTLIGGPVGFLTGSYLAGSAAKKMVQSSSSIDVKEDDNPREQDGELAYEESKTIPSPNEFAPVALAPEPDDDQKPVDLLDEQTKPYQFGDYTRSFVSRAVKQGKQADGRSSSSSYKFGDFTRGLFSS